MGRTTGESWAKSVLPEKTAEPRLLRGTLLRGVEAIMDRLEVARPEVERLMTRAHLPAREFEGELWADSAALDRWRETTFRKGTWVRRCAGGVRTIPPPGIERIRQVRKDREGRERPRFEVRWHATKGVDLQRLELRLARHAVPDLPELRSRFGLPSPDAQTPAFAARFANAVHGIQLGNPSIVGILALACSARAGVRAGRTRASRPGPKRSPARAGLRAFVRVLRQFEMPWRAVVFAAGTLNLDPMLRNLEPDSVVWVERAIDRYKRLMRA